MVSWLPAPAVSQETMILNGQWEMGECRHYSQTAKTLYCGHIFLTAIVACGTVCEVT